MHTRRIGTVLGLLALVFGGFARAEPPTVERPTPSPRERGLEWLRIHANADGSWGISYTTAVTGLGCLAHLASAKDPFEGPRAKPLVAGLSFLLKQQKHGVFPKQGHTWIHGQGFATLALSEAYGRTLFGATKPDLDLEQLKKTIEQAVSAIQEHQSHSGGWWYVPNDPHNHEGSTTVCAVQALVSAKNFGFAIDGEVLTKGFEYLKKCQNPDGGFDYKLGPGTVSMKEGTAAGVSTLALMQRFDYQVMTNGVKFLKRIGPSAITKERFPYYGHFYACMGLTLFGEEMGVEKDAATYITAAQKDVLAWQGEDGGWPLQGWMKSHHQDAAYATAYACLLLGVPDKHLSLFHRRPRTPPVEANKTNAVPAAPTVPKPDSGQ